MTFKLGALNIIIIIIIIITFVINPRCVR